MAIHQYYVGVNPKGGYAKYDPDIDGGYPLTVHDIHNATFWPDVLKALKFFEAYPGFRLMKCSIVIEE
jgi:hypothetical protein